MGGQDHGGESEEMNYTRAERETSIVYDEEERIARIYTASQISIRRLDKLCAEHPKVYRRTWTETEEDQKVTAARYEVPSKYIRFAKPVSESRREALRNSGNRFGRKITEDY